MSAPWTKRYAPDVPRRRRLQPLGNWDVSNVVVVMFAETGSFNQDLSTWNTASLANKACSWRRILQRPLSGWDVGKVTSFRLFMGKSFNQPLNDWDTRSGEAFHQVFYYASAFNQDLSGWTFGAATTMSNMFYNASSFDQDLGWCVDYELLDPYGFGNKAFELTRCGPWCGVDITTDGCTPVVLEIPAADTDSDALGSDSALKHFIAPGVIAAALLLLLL